MGLEGHIKPNPLQRRALTYAVAYFRYRPLREYDLKGPPLLTGCTVWRLQSSALSFEVGRSSLPMPQTP